MLRWWTVGDVSGNLWTNQAIGPNRNTEMTWFSFHVSFYSSNRLHVHETCVDETKEDWMHKGGPPFKLCHNRQGLSWDSTRKSSMSITDSGSFGFTSALSAHFADFARLVQNMCFTLKSFKGKVEKIGKAKAAWNFFAVNSARMPTGTWA